MASGLSFDGLAFLPEMAAPVALIARLGIGTLLIAAGLAKLLQHRPFALTLQEMLNATPVVARVAAFGLSGTEVAVGAGLMTSTLSPAAATAATGLFIGFSAAISLTLLRTEKAVSCGCFGRGRTLTWLAVGRNLSLACLSASLALGVFQSELAGIALLGLLLAEVSSRARHRGSTRSGVATTPVSQ